jgi:hypothetical protein
MSLQPSERLKTPSDIQRRPTVSNRSEPRQLAYSEFVTGYIVTHVSELDLEQLRHVRDTIDEAITNFSTENE